MALAAATTILVPLRKSEARQLWPPLLAAIATYLVIAALAALLTAKLMHYPIWLGWRIRLAGAGTRVPALETKQ